MADNDNHPFDFLAGAVSVEFEFNEGLRGLIDVAKVAVGPSMPQAKLAEALLAVRALLALIDRNMPTELRDKDPRVLEGRRLERGLASLMTPSRTSRKVVPVETLSEVEMTMITNARVDTDATFTLEDIPPT